MIFQITILHSFLAPSLFVTYLSVIQARFDYWERNVRLFHCCYLSEKGFLTSLISLKATNLCYFKSYLALLFEILITIFKPLFCLSICFCGFWLYLCPKMDACCSNVEKSKLRTAIADFVRHFLSSALNSRKFIDLRFLKVE